MTLEYPPEELGDTDLFYTITKGQEVVDEGTFPSVVDGALATSQDFELVASELGKNTYTIEFADGANAAAGESTSFSLHVIPEGLT